MLEQLKKAAELSLGITIRSVSDFILKNELNLDKDMAVLVAEQYFFRQKLAAKIPGWVKYPAILGPPKVSLEQGSSQFTAEFKASLHSGTSAIDLTGGMGVDSYFLSAAFEHFHYNERNPDLALLTEYNFSAMGKTNVTFSTKEAESLLNEKKEKFDLIYMDPARRDNENRKMVGIQDCEPDLSKLKDILLNRCDHLMVKYSPLLDIKSALKLLGNVINVFILAEKNEVKELLLILKENFTGEPEIECVNAVGRGMTQRFKFSFAEESSASVNYGYDGVFLFEPNAAIMKAGAFRSVGARFGITKLSPNSHLYTAESLIEDFPGRIFRISAYCRFDKKEIHSHLKEKKANISVRNFPLKPDEIKVRLGLKDGGETYLFFTQDSENKKRVVICEKI